MVILQWPVSPQGCVKWRENIDLAKSFCRLNMLIFVIWNSVFVVFCFNLNLGLFCSINKWLFVSRFLFLYVSIFIISILLLRGIGFSGSLRLSARWLISDLLCQTFLLVSLVQHLRHFDSLFPLSFVSNFCFDFFFGFIGDCASSHIPYIPHIHIPYIYGIYIPYIHIFQLSLFLSSFFCGT